MITKLTKPPPPSPPPPIRPLFKHTSDISHQATKLPSTCHCFQHATKLSPFSKNRQTSSKHSGPSICHYLGHFFNMPNPVAALTTHS
ncbi:hypothetical protein K504DRAFT_37901 [Pleomassaria siparia CBS 279.74]|uniref:Uncharacterized protein n=1 Tax=Pleomassaria siparia CBS 279.74 TaxID=1314801 RepID=A0A6G1K453_9PLEO|nr:hypothetical protein K504DRAFT_37901 [Pleomassaria siparia CBS 279.74]